MGGAKAEGGEDEVCVEEGVEGGDGGWRAGCWVAGGGEEEGEARFEGWEGEEEKKG